MFDKDGNRITLNVNPNEQVTSPKTFGKVEDRVLLTLEEWLRSSATKKFTNLKQYKELFTSLSSVKQSIVLLADFAFSAGSETMIRPLKANDTSNYTSLKQKIDSINKQINLDSILKVAEINRRIYGRSGFEKVRDSQGFISKLVPLAPENLEPKVVKFELTRLKYPGITGSDGDPGYLPSDVFYLTLMDLDGTYQGLSDLESIKEVMETRSNLELDLREAAQKLWAPMLLAEMDTAGLNDEEERKAFSDFISQLKPGRSIVYNKKVNAKSISLTPDLQSLTIAIARTDEDIIGNFCLHGDSKITDANTGSVFTIKEMYEKKLITSIFTLDHNNKLQKTSNFSVHKSRVKSCYLVRLSDGRSLIASGNHPLLSINGWTTIDDLKKGDFVAAPIRALKLKALLDTDIQYLKIIEKTQYGDEQTYDICVPDTHCFISDDIVVHNSVPKALLAKEKSMNRATLEFSIRALFDGPIKGIQRYVKREIEKQLYDDITATYDKVYGTTYTNSVRVIHQFKPTPIYDIELLKVLLTYQQAGLISTEMIYEIIGWDVTRMPPAIHPAGNATPPEGGKV